MSKIEERVVSLKLQSSQFLSGISTALSAFGKLKAALNFKGADKGLNDISAAAKNVKLDSIASGVESIKSKFSALSVVAITALSNIANKAINAGAQMAKSFTVQPLIDGFGEYELKMGSIQTILANTARHGTGLETVNAELDNLNKYADQTIYNFAEMTKNASLFTNSGMKIEDATSVIKGFSNAAAASGTSAQGAAGAAYQLSQAFSAGTIRLMDWRSLTNVGMGGKNMQDGIIAIADAMGTFEDTSISAKDAAKDFNGSLEEEWLTADVMSNYLRIMANDMTEAEMATLGLNDAAIKTLREQATTAQEAATKVRTFTQLIGTLREAAASGWTETFEILFGDFEEATELFTAASETLGGMLDAMSDRRNTMLQDWEDAGGRAAAIDAIKNAFQALMNIITPITAAFREIFPPMTGARLAEITEAVARFTERLVLSGEGMQKLQRFFAGLFAVVDIGLYIFKMVVDVLGNVLGAATSGSSGILDLAAAFGDFLVRVRDAIKSGEGLQRFFNKISYYLVFATIKIKQFVTALIDGLLGLDLGAFSEGFSKISERAKPLEKIGAALKAVWGVVLDVLKRVGAALAPVGKILKDMFGNLGDLIMDSLKNLDFNIILDMINTGLFATLIVAFKKFLGDFGKESDKPGLLDSIKEAFGGLTDTLDQMQTTLKSTTLVLIAVAIGVLTASVVALSMIDSKKLASALAAITAMVLQLSASMMILNGVNITGGLWKLPALGAAMILLAIGVNILASAVRKLSELDWQELAKGLVGVTVLLAALAGSSQLMAKNAGGMISAGIGLALLAVAVRLLVGAVEDLAGMDWEELAKGLVGVGTLIAALGLFSKFASAGKGSVAQGVGILLLAAAIKILVSAVEDFAGMSWEEIAKGLVTLAGALGIIAGAMALLPSSIGGAAALLIISGAITVLVSAMQSLSGMSWEDIAQALIALGGALIIIAGAMAIMTGTIGGAAALVIFATALNILAPALMMFAEMSWMDIAQALVTLAGALVIIAGGMALMTTAIAGAAALIVVATSLRILAPVLMMFAGLTWGEIARGLTMLAGAFAVIGIAGLVLTPVVPVLIALGGAILLLAAGVLVAGAGVLLFATALTALAAAGTAATGVAVAMVKALLDLLPDIARAIGEAIKAFADTIKVAAPSIVEAVTVVITSLLDAVIKLTPKVAKTFETLVRTFMKVVRDLTPEAAQTFMVLLTNLLNVIDKMAPKIIQTLERMLSLMLDALVRSVPKMVQAGVDIITGVLKGVTDNIDKIVPLAADMIVKFLNAIGDQIPKVTQAGVELIVKFVNSVADAIRNNTSAMNSAGRNLASAIISGMTSGITGGVSAVTNAAKDVARSALNAAKSFLGIHSPSREFAKVGRWSTEGFALGFLNYSWKSARASRQVGEEAVENMRRSLKEMPRLFGGLKDTNPVITPILDLTSFKREAKNMAPVLAEATAVSAVAPQTTTSSAKGISRSYQRVLLGEDGFATPDVPRASMVFNQYNHSPKALSQAEIYRQTKNQLSKAKRGGDPI